ncbi:hypothetical protein [Stenotrophomonas maltophilia]|uniref:Uncharacterized protein n=1 Tax=Stenotrophomonas maltophilia TaxID=40324 RepID=A0A2W6HW80_STEMA|nr:hypothetical protein [Stenotrophomonas maltophilia]PZS87671.1 hypothetical protein A7X83_01635 [Stenotrophomonas maltophilia]
MTTFEQDVSTLRANANGALLDQIVGFYGDASDIEPWHTLHSLLWPDLSENEDTRRAQIGPAMEKHTDELRRYIRRYDDLRNRRLDALSNYDLGVAYRQSGPENGLFQALDAVRNHIGRVRAQILWLLAEQVRLTPPQLALF